MPLNSNTIAESPVFIIAPTERSGTNYLSRLIRLNPVFKMPAPIYEDYLLRHSHLLSQYSDLSAKAWSTWIDKTDSSGRFARRLIAYLGDGILSFLRELMASADRRLLLKTPASENIDQIFKLFPNGKLILLVRDGRDAVESLVRTFPERKYEFCMESWAKGARRILDFTKGNEGSLAGKSWKLVKYEDVVKQPEKMLGEILIFLGEKMVMKPEAIHNMPLVGSSTHRGDSPQVNWKPLQKPADFNPIGRWTGWNFWLKRKFKKIAGRELIELGYVSDNKW